MPDVRQHSRATSSRYSFRRERVANLPQFRRSLHLQYTKNKEVKQVKIIGKIYETTDYDLFKKLPDNRDVLSGRVNKLIASISERYILNPIAVNEKWEIIDGQGRFEARKALGLPIHFYIVSGASSDDCRRLNKYNTKWEALDFAKSWASAGKQAYVRLLKTSEYTKLSISDVLRLANKGQTASKTVSGLSAYERGELVFEIEDMEIVAKVKEMSDEILDALANPARPNSVYRHAVKVMVETEGYSHERMLKNCRTCRATFAMTKKLGDQLTEFERIYNKNLSAKNKIYFSDYMRNRGYNVRTYETMHKKYNEKDVSTLK